MANYRVVYTSRNWDYQEFNDREEAVNAFMHAYRQYTRGLRGERPEIWEAINNDGLVMRITEKIIK